MSRKKVRSGDRLPLSTLYQTLIKDSYYGHLGDKRVDELITNAGGKYLLIGPPTTQKTFLLLMAWARMEPGGLPVFNQRRQNEVTKKRLFGFYTESDAFLKLETTYGSFGNFLRQQGLPTPHELFPDQPDSTINEVKSELGWEEAIEIGELKEELEEARRNLKSLQSSDPEYIRRKREAKDEVIELNKKIADLQFQYDEKFKALQNQPGQKETTQERDKRLKKRVSQVYPTKKNLNQTIDQIYEEEQRPGGSEISRETLRRIVRIPK